MSSDHGRKQLHAFFSGRVQGVGFRYTVCELASSFAVTGFVKNLWDGDVELVAEGAHQELVDFLNRIRTSRLGRGIVQVRVGWNEASDRFKQFGIEF
ncbi:acylphosphatase [Verrucomicrobia bacterium S94]|nr:acylphosphatase [Verrucomicrobia bacterium S94]